MKRMKTRLDTTILNRVSNPLDRILATVPVTKRHQLFQKVRPFKERARKGAEAYKNPAELMIAAALVNRTKYDVVIPKRLRHFRTKYPRVVTIHDLRKILVRLTEREVSEQVLRWGYRKKHYRAALLRNLVMGFDTYGQAIAKRRGRRISDYEVLRRWARESDPQVALERMARGRIPGLGPKLVAWLRMYGGDVETVPYDLYTKQGMAYLGFKDMGNVAEFIADLFGLSRHTLDMAFRHGSY